MPDPPPVLATFVARDNRFVLRAALADGTEVRAYLPNTARLADVLVPGARLVLRPASDPARRTRWSATRVWDGAWVSLEAGAAATLVAEHLAAGGVLPGWPPARAVRREVTHAGHRFDLEVGLDDGRTAIVEVKSLSRARDGVAPLSDTPSTRGAAHLEALADLSSLARPTAVVFVVQRGDATALDLAAPAAPAWQTAVRGARARGVEVLAFACEVDEHDARLGHPLHVRDRAAARHGP